MIKLIISFVLILIVLVNGLDPPGICFEQTPFRLNDQTCGKFEEICIKTEDDQCIQLLNSCKQCPPNNITITILLKIWNSLKSFTESQIVPLNRTQQFMGNGTNSIFYRNQGASEIIAVLILVIIILILLIVEMRFKIITKLFFCRSIKERSKYNLVNSRKRFQIEEFNKNMETKFTEFEKFNKNLETKFTEFERFNEKMETKFTEFENLLKSSSNGSKNTQLITTKLILGEEEPVQLNKKGNIKQFDSQKYEGKRIKFCYNGRILDNNECLLDCINSRNSFINCYVDFTINIKDTIVVKLKSEMELPETLNININQTLEEVETMIKSISNVDKLAIFKEITNNRKLVRMKDKDVFVDGDELIVVEKTNGKFKIRSILNYEKIIDKEYENTDFISSLAPKENVDFILFHNKEKLDQDKFIFEYKIPSGSTLDCYTFEINPGFEVPDKPISQNKIFKLYHTQNQKRENILLKMYSLESHVKDGWKGDEFILNELKIFQTTKYNLSFVQLSDTFLTGSSLCVSMEFMPNGMLKTYLKNHKVSVNEFTKWSDQILSGLKFLHDRQVIHRDLNPSNIYLDEKLNLKLSSSNLSKFELPKTAASVMGKISVYENLKYRYMAPEILSCDKYGQECDIWSFGAVLIRIITGKRPYSEYDNYQDVINMIKGKVTIEYDVKDIENELQRFMPLVNSCLKIKPEERAKMDSLQNQIKQ